jgi:hypothetical protein
MKYSASAARKLAQQIRERFGRKISEACLGTPVPPALVAGLISVEAGKDRNGQIKEEATRFEPHVFAKLKQVREGTLTQYNKIRHRVLENADDDALKNLATSYQITQTMGWWAIHLGITVEELRNSDTHLKWAVQLLMLNAGRYIEDQEWANVLRIWNTGKPTGKTHDSDYVYNATSVMNAYRNLLADVSEIELPERITAHYSGDPEHSEPFRVDVTPAKVETKPEPDPVIVKAEEPKPTDPKEKAEVSGPKSWVASVVGFAGTGIGGIISWVQGASKILILAFFGAAVLIGIVYIIGRFWYRNRENQRLADIQMQREQRAHDITVLKMKSAMDDDLHTVEVVKSRP